jgi:hypothetical protein
MKKKLNVKLLRRVQKHILAVPERLDMGFLALKVNTEDEGAPPCGTVGCIAGWAHMLTLKKFPKTSREISNADDVAWERAEKKIGLSHNDSYALFGEPRFYQDTDFRRWPAKFAVRYLKAKKAKTRAKVTSDRIDHFIKTKGAE